MKQPSYFSQFRILRKAKHLAFAAIPEWSNQRKADRPVLAAIRRGLRPGDLAVDVGANAGKMTKSMRRSVGPDGFILAIEANPDMVHRLRNRFVRHRNVAVLELALTGRLHDPSTPFDLARIDTRSGIGIRGTQDTVAQITVPATTLDDLKLTRLDLLKIDAEGMDLEVLYGAADTIRKLRPGTVIIECRPWDETESEIRSFFEEYNYHATRTTYDIIATRR